MIRRFWITSLALALLSTVAVTGCGEKDKVPHVKDTSKIDTRLAPAGMGRGDGGASRAITQ